MKCLVNLVEHWEDFEEYAGDKIGFYQIVCGVKLEVRVTAGKLGFKKEFDNSDDPLLERIKEFCGFQGYFKISESIRDEQFFK